MRIKAIFASIAGSALLLSSVALAHVSVTGPGVAGTNQVLSFNVGHGCEGADTYRIEVQIPEEVLSLRPMPGGAFGDAVLTKNAEGLVTQVAWEKPTVIDADEQYYQLHIRMRIPDMPFQTLYFPVVQYCRTAEGVESVTNWTALPGEKGEPAADLVILPERLPGWNKYTVPAAIDDLSMFDDAQIVWSGDAAYSANPTTMELINDEPNVTVLTQIAAGAEIWVKY